MRLQEAFEFRAKARESLAGKWGLAVGVCFVAWILADAFTSASSTQESVNMVNSTSGSFFISSSFSSLGSTINFILAGPIAFGLASFFLNLVREEGAEFSNLFDGFTYFLKTLVLEIIRMIFIILWTFLFIIPGIIAALRYSMAYYILYDNPELTFLEAIGESKKMMRGHKARLFGLWLSFIGWFILCIFTAGIGFFWLTPYYKAAEAHFYEEISSL